MSVNPANPAPENAPNAVTSMVLGILSIVICSPLGPFAWNMGAKAEKAVDASGGRLGGRGLATAGKITGIIGTVLLVLGILFLLLVVVAGVSTS